MEKLIDDFSFGLFFIMTAAFLILLFILKKYAFGPIMNAIDSREDGIRQALESAEKARQDMANLKSDNEKLMREARAERDEMLKEAREIKEKIIADASAEADKKADEMIGKAKEAIQAEKQAAMSDIKAQMAELSIGIAEKVVQKELDAKDKQMQLVDSLLNDVKLN